MSLRRVIVGLLVGACLLALALAGFWYCSLPPLWVPGSLFVVAALVAGLMEGFQQRRALRKYWDRVCTGIQWRRRFPDSSASEIREFLNTFVDAFGFRRRRRCCFSPDDKVMDVYRTLYPPDPGWPDSMELEGFARNLEKRYGIDLVAAWREDITLGELYSQTRQAS
jgi:propanediol dehydratase small subunit